MDDYERTDNLDDWTCKNLDKMQQNERNDYADANIIDKNDSAFIRSKRDLVHSIFRHQMLCRTRNLYSSNFRNIRMVTVKGCSLSYVLP